MDRDRDGWDFQEWQAALGGLAPESAALVGLAAAERIAGCLRDERFRSHAAGEADVVEELLAGCWERAAPERLRELAAAVEECSVAYADLVMDGDDDEEVPEGSLMLHLDALTAVAEAAAACAGGPWDGALRCLQTTAMAAVSALERDPRALGADVELRRQREDLARVGAGDEGVRVAADLRGRAREDAQAWHRAVEELALDHD